MEKLINYIWLKVENEQSMKKLYDEFLMLLNNNNNENKKRSLFSLYMEDLIPKIKEEYSDKDEKYLFGVAYQTWRVDDHAMYLRDRYPYLKGSMINRYKKMKNELDYLNNLGEEEF